MLVQYNLNDATTCDAFATMRKDCLKYVDSSHNKDSSFHAFVKELPSECVESLEKFLCLAQVENKLKNTFRSQYNVVRVVEMDELYCSAKAARNSDRVFLTPHIDGMYGWIPSMWLFRGILVLKEDLGTVTHFIKEMKALPLSVGTVTFFDYNRDPHFIIQNRGDGQIASDRIVLKLHYCVYPKQYGFLKLSRYFSFLNSNYNGYARKGFLLTLESSGSIIGGLVDRMIMLLTRSVAFQYKVGIFNFLFFAVLFFLFYKGHVNLASLAYLSLIPHIFYVLPYFLKIHYVGFYLRDMLVFKFFMMFLLGFLYFSFPIHKVSLFLTIVGLLWVYYCYRILGDLNTYLIEELQPEKQVCITKFPYSHFKHPMLIGNIVFFMGMSCNPFFFKKYGILMILQVLSYLFVSFLEVYSRRDKITYEDVYDIFKQHHTKKVNIIGHLITSYIMMVGLFSIIYNAFSLFGLTLLFFFYGYFAMNFVFRSVYTLLFLLILCLSTFFLNISLGGGLILFFAGLFLQDALHLVVREKTFFYSHLIHRKGMFVLGQIIFFIPLILDSFWERFLFLRDK